LVKSLLPLVQDYLVSPQRLQLEVCLVRLQQRQLELLGCPKGEEDCEVVTPPCPKGAGTLVEAVVDCPNGAGMPVDTDAGCPKGAGALVLAEPTASSSSSGLFGQTTPASGSSGLFGKSTATSGSSGPFGQPVSTPSAGGLFGQPASSGSAPLQLAVQIILQDLRQRLAVQTIQYLLAAQTTHLIPMMVFA
jgi:hypothetical protein